MIGIWLDLLRIQEPFFHIDIEMVRLNSSFKAYYDYFFVLEDKLNPNYKIIYSRRDFITNKERLLIKDYFDDSIRIYIDFLNGNSKGVSIFFKRPIKFVNLSFNFMSIDYENFSRFLVFYRNDHIFSGLRIKDKVNFVFYSKFFGLSLNEEKFRLYALIKNCLITYTKDTISFYNYFYILKPIFIAHFFVNSKREFFISPLYLFDVDKAVYLIFSNESGLGFKSRILSFETGYNFRNSQFYLFSNLNHENIKFNLISNSDKNWIFQTDISEKLWKGKIKPGIIFTKYKENHSITFYTKIYGLIIYYLIERDTLSNLKNFWGFKLSFID